MDTLEEEYQSFTSAVSEGITIEHFGQDKITVYTVKEYYEADEIACENDFSDNYSEASVSVENILDGSVDIVGYEHQLALESWVNGQHQQMYNQITDFESFVDYLDFHKSKHLLPILKCLVSTYL